MTSSQCGVHFSACQPRLTLRAREEQSVDNLVHLGADQAQFGAEQAQCRSGRMTFVRMIDSLMVNWRSSSLTSAGSAVRLMTA